MSITIYTHTHRASLLSGLAQAILRLRKRFKDHGLTPDGYASEKAMQTSRAGYILPKKTALRYRISLHTCEGMDVYRLLPPAKTTQRDNDRPTILYLPGGSFWHEPVDLHWSFLRKLTNATGCRVLCGIYPKAPAYGWQDAQGALTVCYRELLRTTSPEQIILMGDSAGATLALSVTQQLEEKGAPVPSRLILFSPAADLSISSEGALSAKSKDAMLDRDTVMALMRYYACGLELSSPLISPLHGRLEGMCPMDIYVGTYDILAADAIELAHRASEAGVIVRLYVYPKMAHIFPLFGILRESKSAFSQVVDSLR